MTTPWVLHLVSHTHWDREWYFSYQRYRYRLVKLMDELLTIYREQPEFKSFNLDAQAIVLKDYLEIRPERYEECKAAVAAGKLDVGPWYTQPNTFLTSGEAIIRNLMYGIRQTEPFGAPMRVCYLPDAFGMCSQTPQIMAGFDIDDVVIWRGIPRNTKTVFRWKGADGTEATAFYMLDGYGTARMLPVGGEDYVEWVEDTPIPRSGLKARVDTLVKRLGERSTSPHLLFMNGIDHAFPQYELPQVIEQINTTIDGVTAVHGNLKDYIDAVKRYHSEHNVALDCIEGELRDHSEGIILAGSQSTRVKVKQFSRRVETLFEKWMEPFTAYAWALGQPLPGAEMWRAWEYLLQNHAHDSQVLSSVDATYHQVIARFEWADELGDEVVQESLQYLIHSIAGAGTEREKTLVVFNPLNWARSETITTVIDVPAALNFASIALRDGDADVPLVIHRVEDDIMLKYNPSEGALWRIPMKRYTVTFSAEGIPSCGFKAYQLVEAPRAAHVPGELIGSEPTRLENEMLRVDIHPNGTLSVLHKPSGRSYDDLLLIEDSGDAGEGFSYMPPERDHVVYSAGSAAQISWVENSALRATARIDLVLNIPAGLTADGKARSADTVPCPISSFVTLTRGAERVDVETHVHNAAKSHRLRVLFPSRIDADTSYAEQPFDIVSRPVALPDLSLQYAEPPSATHPQLTYAGITDGTHGLMIANEGLYEYEVSDTPDRHFALTLLRAIGTIHFPFDGSKQNDIPEAQCLGDHVFRYSIIPHSGSWDAAWHTAHNFAFPMRAVLERTPENATLRGGTLPQPEEVLDRLHSFVEVSGADVEVTAVKKAEGEDALVVRLFNPADQAVRARVSVRLPNRDVREVVRLNLNEDVIGSIEHDGSQIEVELRAKEIGTVAFRL